MISFDQEPIRRVVSLVPGVQYVYRQHALDFNPKEINNSVANFYLICEEQGVEAKGGEEDGESNPEKGSLIGTEALLQLVAHLVSNNYFHMLFHDNIYFILASDLICL